MWPTAPPGQRTRNASGYSMRSPNWAGRCSSSPPVAGRASGRPNARQYDPKVIVEAAIEGREIECSVLEGAGGAPPDTSLPGQLLIEGGEEFWDFEAKYLDEASEMAIPAPIPPEHQREIRRMSALAFAAVSSEGPPPDAFSS